MPRSLRPVHRSPYGDVLAELPIDDSSAASLACTAGPCSARRASRKNEDTPPNKKEQKKNNPQKARIGRTFQKCRTNAGAVLLTADSGQLTAALQAGICFASVVLPFLVSSLLNRIMRQPLYYGARGAVSCCHTGTRGQVCSGNLYFAIMCPRVCCGCALRKREASSVPYSI